MNSRIKYFLLSFTCGTGIIVLSPQVFAYDSNDYYCYRMPTYPFRYCTQNPQADFPYNQQYFYGNGQTNFPYNNPNFNFPYNQQYYNGNLPMNYSFPNPFYDYNNYNYEYNYNSNQYFQPGYNDRDDENGWVGQQERFPDMPPDTPQ